MILVRTLLAAAFVALGAVIAVRMFSLAPQSGFKIVPGLVLGLAMIALGVHRLALIFARLRGAA